MPFDAAAVRRWLEDIHYQIVLARKFTEGMDYETFHGEILPARRKSFEGRSHIRAR
jgi:hypothetical protein